MSVLPVSGLTGPVNPASAASAYGVGGAGGVSPTSPTAPTAAAGQAGGTSGVSNDGFANVLGDALSSVQASDASADNLATQAATGSLTNVSDYMVAANEADVQTQLTVAVRNSALQAFQQIMGMQL